ncbi:MAG: RNA methyltransferase [Candidatus Latescibacteria bacterium]|nr:RNA methyltransferase [Candidatus Latescibacterota bacterium]
MSEKNPVFSNIQIVLVEPKVPGNVGAASRAIKNMGLSRLVVVNPWFQNHPQARYMAHGSEDILDSAEIVPTLKDAVASSIFVVGTTQRQRRGVPFMNPRQAASEVINNSVSGPVSILFGREDRGLLNEELAYCQILVNIPSSETQPSLNLSQAVMVIAYELFTGMYPVEKTPQDYASSEDLSTMYDHLKNSLDTLGMRQWNDGDNYMKSLRRVFSRTRLERRDVATIHKLCGEIDKYAHRTKTEIKKEFDK